MTYFEPIELGPLRRAGAAGDQHLEKWRRDSRLLPSHPTLVDESHHVSIRHMSVSGVSTDPVARLTPKTDLAAA